MVFLASKKRGRKADMRTQCATKCITDLLIEPMQKLCHPGVAKRSIISVLANIQVLRMSYRKILKNIIENYAFLAIMI